MKQKDLTRLLAALLKNEAKARGWRSIAGEPYWTAGPLFFTLVVAANASRHSLYCSLRVKWSCLDDHLWNILGMAENAKAPSSLRANGAFTLSGQEIFAQTHENCDWGEAGLETTLRGVASQAASIAAHVADTTPTIDDYLALVEREHLALLTRHPGAVVNTWKEQLLVALEKGDSQKAAAIAQQRIAAHDSGGFMAEGRTFFQRALAYIADA